MAINRKRFIQLAGELTKPDGGYSVDDKTGNWGPSGYYVGQPGLGAELPPGATVTGSHIARHAANTSASASVPGHSRNYLGGWNDPKTGTVYLDRSIRFSSLHKAHQQTIANNEISFYGTKEGRSIDNMMRQDRRIPSQLRERQAGVAKRHIQRTSNPPSPLHIDPNSWVGH